jgi:hypothetical protein
MRHLRAEIGTHVAVQDIAGTTPLPLPKHRICISIVLQSQKVAMGSGAQAIFPDMTGIEQY